jgi:hypothetical protein
MSGRGVLLLGLLGLVACACRADHVVGHDEPADVAGVYSLSLTNGADGCLIAGAMPWREGEPSTNIGLTITQTGSAVTARVEGLAGGALALFVNGTADFKGTVSGSVIDMVIYGTLERTVDACTFTIDNHVRATVTGDHLAGELVYTRNLVRAGRACQHLACTSTQLFAGARPPRSDAREATGGRGD